MVCKSLGPSMLVTAALALSGGMSLFGQEKPMSASPAQASTNAAHSSRSMKPQGLKDLEQSIFKPWHSLEPEASLDPVMQRPQRPPPVPNKRLKEEIERRKNWAFMTPEEIINGKTADDPSNPQGANKDDQNKSLSPMDRYFQRLYGQDKIGKSNKAAKRDVSGFDSSERDADDQNDSTAGLPQSVRETQRNLKKKQGKEEESKTSRSGFFTDVFALERKKPTVEEERVERDRMDAYRKMLGLEPAPSFGPPSSPFLADPKDPYRIVLPPALVSSTPAVAPASPVAPSRLVSPINPFMDPVPNKGAAPSSLAPLPKVEPTKSYLPPQPTFSAPRRSF